MVSRMMQTTQSTLLLKKKKELREVDDALAFMKEEFRNRMRMCEERESKFKDKQAEMKSMVRWLLH
jgi:flagellar motility protein MotE (MotC chaperone)